MAIPAEMQMFAARLASFEAAQPRKKKRGSGVKGAKTATWPADLPLPEQLARAGLFFNPSSTALDNTTCFFCQNSIDGWEPEDDPIKEHLSLSPDCAWAINTAVEQATENGEEVAEDPMSDRFLEARKETFGTSWPHDGKRGWTCKSQKMIEAGWYHCPTAESDDYVKCPYCLLGLDGWEPKDKPLDEHKRRSPGCTFFTLSSASKKGAIRGKKARVSKGSRLSVQSSTSFLDNQSTVDDIAFDADSIVSTATDAAAMSTTAKSKRKATGTKKGKAATKAKSTRAKTTEETQAKEHVPEPEDDNFEVKVDQPLAKGRREKKRGSEDITVDESAVEVSRPPTKKRLTRGRGSTVKPEASDQSKIQIQDEDTTMADVQDDGSELIIPKKAGKAGRKRGSSSMRKASTMSTASVASLRIPQEAADEIEAELQAEFDRPPTDDEGPEILKRTMPVKEKPRNQRLAVEAEAHQSNHLRAAQPVDSDMKDVQERTIEEAAQSEGQEHGDETNIGEQESNPKVKAKTTRAKKAKKPKTTHTAAKKGKADSQKILETQDRTDPLAKSQAMTETQDIPVGEIETQYLEVIKEPSPVPVYSDHTAISSMVEPQPYFSPTVQDSSAVMSSPNWAVYPSDDEAPVPHAPPPPPIFQMDPPKKKRGRPSNQEKKAKAESVRKARESEQARETTVVKSTVEQLVAEQDSAFAEVEDIQAPAAQKGKKITKGKGTRGRPKKNKDISAMLESSVVQETDVVDVMGTDASRIQTPPPAPIEQPPSPSPVHHTEDHSKEQTPPPAAPARQPPSPSPAHQMPPPSSLKEATRNKPAPPTPSPARIKNGLSSPTPSPQSSDAENHPPSSRPSQTRPPLVILSPSQLRTQQIPLAPSTPTMSPSKRLAQSNNVEKLHTTYPWNPVELETVFLSLEKDVSKENKTVWDADGLTSPEMKMTVEEWIMWNAQKGEERLREECERAVGIFENEGVKALKCLEGIVCRE